MAKERIRVLLSKVGLDGHVWGVLAVGLALKEAGMEVVYLGRHVMPAEIAEAAIQEDVDVVGISSLADGHRELAPAVVNALREKGSNVPVILGGFIQPEDVPELKSNGVAEVFGIHTRFEDIVSWIKANAGNKTGRAAKQTR